MDSEELEIERDVAIDGVSGMVCGVGIAGNILVLFVNLVLKEYEKTATNWYVLQLAAADLLCLITVPFGIAEDLLGRWSFPEWTCKAKETIFFVNYFASVMILTAMSIERYCAVCRSFSPKIQQLRTKKTAVLTAVIIWAVAILMSFPILLSSEVNGIAPYCKCRNDFSVLNKRAKCAKEELTDEECEKVFNEPSCIQPTWNESEYENYLSGDYAAVYSNEYSQSGQDWEWPPETESSDEEYIYEMGCSYKETSFEWKAYIFWCFTTMFVIPFTLVTFSYSCIIMKLRRSGLQSEHVYRRNSSTRSRNSNNRKKPMPTGVQRKRARVTRVCFALVLVFLICWCPFYAVHMVKMVGIRGTTQHCNVVTLIFTVLAYSNSAINPFIYNFMGTSFVGRIRQAASSVKSSLNKITSSSFSSDGGFGVRFVANKRNEKNVGLNSATATAKFCRGKREAGNLGVQGTDPTGKRTDDASTQKV